MRGFLSPASWGHFISNSPPPLPRVFLSLCCPSMDLVAFPAPPGLSEKQAQGLSHLLSQFPLHLLPLRASESSRFHSKQSETARGGPGTFGAEAGWGSRCFGRTHFHTDVFSYKTLRVEEQEVGQVANDKACEVH